MCFIYFIIEKEINFALIIFTSNFRYFYVLKGKVKNI